MSPPPPRRYSKTDLRRGAVALIQTSAKPAQVAADEQAALFGEAATPPEAQKNTPAEDRTPPARG